MPRMSARLGHIARRSSAVVGVRVRGACSTEGAHAVRFDRQPTIEARHREQPLDRAGRADEHHADAIARQLISACSRVPARGSR